ncbi:hypothetical protein S83_063166 [Arachis hypogaea]
MNQEPNGRENWELRGSFVTAQPSSSLRVASLSPWLLKNGVVIIRIHFAAEVFHHHRSRCCSVVTVVGGGSQSCCCVILVVSHDKSLFL